MKRLEEEVVGERGRIGLLSYEREKKRKMFLHVQGKLNYSPGTKAMFGVVTACCNNFFKKLF